MSHSHVDLNLVTSVERALHDGNVVHFGDYAAAILNGQLVLKYPVSQSRDGVFESDVIGPSSNAARLVTPFLQAMTEGEQRALYAHIQMALLSEDIETAPRLRLPH